MSKSTRCDKCKKEIELTDKENYDKACENAVEVYNYLKEAKYINKKFHEEITWVATSHNDLKFRHTYEKLDLEVLINIFKTEVLFLRADTEEIALQDKFKFFQKVN